ncbi:threonine ammonia-lyase [Conexibacter stalactiti]|uniref:Threonine ammonia-lyase n=1 Tax=Conexibacter stalactiti TaxID=1940611 RepID=A0ABU4HJA0_9ACTN|nr:threonine ammonia-lyase [Conexibacter stalactiti]MDW5593387.1 threonine ammonia-lyase [Conexibacter stalactiti]MEC5034028.1 threonine ammonia-lyase [Conexibacter stalactiti]
MTATGVDVDAAHRWERLVEVHAASAQIARRTAVLSSASISERVGGAVALKAECLQRTGSFKLRGALAKLRGVDRSRGVVAGSAGNHAQSLAYAARRYGLACEVFMPVGAAVSKLDAVRAFGAVVQQRGASVDDCVALARERADEAGMTFVHPFDDDDVIAGQAGVGVELAGEVDELRRVLIPVGGGGLASGVALALRQALPGVELIGVQASACAPFVAAFAGAGAAPGRAVAAGTTIADGIAVKRPGAVTLPLLNRLLDDLCSVEEEAIAEAMVLLLERSKLLVEGAGAAALAALLSGVARPAARGTTVAILSGGNVDVSLLAAIAARQETRVGRRARLFTRVSDRPGGIAGLLDAVAAADANVIDVDHVRDGVELRIRETGVGLTLETRGADHLGDVLAALRAAGYDVSVRG